MKISSENIRICFNNIPVDNFWSVPHKPDSKMHKIHAYPAKFPSIMISKALKYSEDQGIEIKSIGDIFCGCGTTALEAKLQNKDFWGWDINPVATLIAKVKSKRYQKDRLIKYFDIILDAFKNKKLGTPHNYLLNERLNYWFSKDAINQLFNLLTQIKTTVPHGKYRNYFLCAFSNILKGSSRWLTKSIKPQIDPVKEPADVETAFKKQFTFMLKAIEENKEVGASTSKTTILTKNFLKTNFNKPFIDMLITSPPYVTSYEYADLHQLSTLWLGYANDYRNLREGTIGSLYHKNITDEDIDMLNDTGKSIVKAMDSVDKRKAKSIAKYFIDMNQTIIKAFNMINPGGLAFFIIGNTRYKNVDVDNAMYLSNCMINLGFTEIEVFKRKINFKNLTPYRDKKGRFSRDPKNREVYSHEFVIIAKKDGCSPNCCHSFFTMN